MKKTVAVLLLIFSFHFLKAESDGFNFYISKDYESAWNYYFEKFEQNADPLASYNLGVIAEKFNKPGLAIYYYIQTLQRLPDFSQAKNNLSILIREENLTVPGILLEPDRPVDITLIIFFAALYIFSLLFSILCFKPDWRIKTALFPIFFVLIITAILYFFKYNETANETWGVSVERSSLHSGPDTTLREVGKLREGEILMVESVSGQWAKIKGFHDNVEGWVEMSNIRRIIRGSR